MTATAQGATLACDYAGCTAPATVERDAWGFCETHADKHDQERPGASAPRMGRPSAPVAPVAPVSAAQPSAPMPQVIGGGTIGLLLEQASAHSNKRVRNLAAKIETQLDDLRNRIADLAEDEKRKRLEAETKEKARQDIIRLEQQLAAAKAKLRKPKTATASSAPAQELPCRNGCGRVYASPQGRGKHERRCTAVSS